MFVPNQEPASARSFGNGSVIIGTQGLFRPYMKTFLPPFLPTRLTATGSPRMLRHLMCTRRGGGGVVLTDEVSNRETMFSQLAKRAPSVVVSG